jgi:outer membrane protein OmpA-like peptidoglycan-associated protein
MKRKSGDVRVPVFLAVAFIVSSAIAAPVIPLCQGLTVVTAVNQPNGDYESIKTVESIDADRVRLKYSNEAYSEDFLTGEGGLRKTIIKRGILKKDLRTSNMYQQVFLTESDEVIPETTSIGVSAAVLKALKTKGETEFAISGAYPGVHLTADPQKEQTTAKDYMQWMTLKRTGTAKVPVLVNDRRVELPAIVAQGETGGVGGDQNEFFILDDESNPLILKFRLGVGSVAPLTPEGAEVCEGIRKSAKNVEELARGYAGATQMWINCALPKGGDRDVLRVVKITYRCGKGLDDQGGGGGGGGGSAPGAGDLPGVPALEEQLAKQRRADIYSIYFSFNSDAIREESEPTLKEIADVMRKHPDWSLSVNGHTDAIGGDQSNLVLSQRRSAAVKNALVKRYKIDPNRLVTGGAGRSQPKDTNDTVEGRARNRRVELVRSD